MYTYMHICSYIVSFRSPSFIQNDYAKAGAGYAKGVENFKGVSHIFNSFLLSRLPLYFCSYLFFHNFNGQGSVRRFLQSARIFFCIYTYTCTQTYLHAYTRIRLHIYTYTFTYTYTYTYTYTLKTYTYDHMYMESKRIHIHKQIQHIKYINIYSM
jgi:hypothetical protein